MKKIILFSSGLLFSSFGYSGGLYLYENATEDVGLASAGQAARAQDASTVYANPAGMTRLSGAMMNAGLQALYGDVRYSLNDDSRLSSRSPGNVVGWFPASSAFYAQPINDSLSFGLGMYGNYGLGLDFGNWSGDRLIKKSTLIGLTFSPAIAWKINDRLSVGFAPGINYGYLAITRNVNDEDKKETDHDWAMNYRLGILFELTPQTRAGLTWQSETEYHFNIAAKARVSQNGVTQEYALPIAAQVNTPQQLMFSLYHDLNPQWALMGNLGWQDWSRYSGSEIAVAGSGLASNDRLKDTWHTALGVQYRPTEQWRLNAGVAYDSSFYRSQDNASLTMPSGAAWRFGTGAQYQMTANSNIGLAVEYLTMESAKVNSSLFGGAYDNPDMWFFVTNLGYRF